MSRKFQRQHASSSLKIPRRISLHFLRISLRHLGEFEDNIQKRKTVFVRNFFFGPSPGPCGADFFKILTSFAWSALVMRGSCADNTRSGNKYAARTILQKMPCNMFSRKQRRKTMEHQMTFCRRARRITCLSAGQEASAAS